MKILVITFSRGLNPGTFMQALGVRTGLKKVFPEASIEYLNFPDFKRGFFGVRNDKDSVLSLARQKASALYRKIKYRKLENKFFPQSARIDLFDYDETFAKNLLNSYDLVAVGSDTILEEAYGASGKIGLNWLGRDVCQKPYFFFAASASPANFELSDAVKNRLRENVEGAFFIGLRDLLTINFFEKKLGVENALLIKQPDPTFFLDAKKFEVPVYYRRKIQKRKTVLYNFNAMFPYKRELAAMLQEKGYYVVTTGSCPGVNLCINTIDATEWAGVFKYCDLVVTERFHDTIFALRNEKPVVTIDWAKHRFSENGDSKTFRILEDSGMLDYHFHLKEKEDLRRIVDMIDDLKRSFKPENIRKRNAEFISLSASLMDQVKDKFLEMGGK